jgi:transposase
VEHVAIDLGGKESQICARSADGEILEERSCPTAELGQYLRKRPKSKVVVETCAEAFAVADKAKELGHEVCVVPSVLVRGLGVGARGVKNDVRDARALSEASCRMSALPSVHVPTAESRRRKSLCGMRDGLVRSRTVLINTVRGWLRSNAARLPSGSPTTFALRVRKYCESHRANELPSYVERQLQVIEALSQQIDEADKDVAALAEGDPTCVRLMSMPGVGPVTAVRYAAALDDVMRFPNAHRVESYLGLTPGEDSSSGRSRRTALTKAGAPAVRWVLTQAAWTARRCRPNDPMVLWSIEVEKRRGRKVAIMALVRKMAGILFAMWRSGSTYDANYQNKLSTVRTQ